MTAQEIMAELAGRKCVCGRIKHAGRTFCLSCYYWLPDDMKMALDRRIGEGYEQAYEAAAAVAVAKLESDRLKNCQCADCRRGKRAIKDAG